MVEASGELLIEDQEKGVLEAEVGIELLAVRGDGAES